MALVITLRSFVGVTTGASSYTAAPTYTPAANSLLISFVEGSLAASPTDPTSVTGHGISFGQITVTGTLSTTHIMSVWTADAGASPSSVACVATFASGRTGGCIHEYEVTGAFMAAGVGLGGAILQCETATGTAAGFTATNLLAAATSADNRAMAVWLHLANEVTASVGGNWAEPANADHNFNSPPTGFESQVAASAFDRSPGATWSTSSLYRVIALEIDTPVTAEFLPKNWTPTFGPILAQ